MILCLYEVENGKHSRFQYQSDAQ
ncbi:hypothetical protein OOU_Y34scaffold00720g5 [Pyricularia oryzae Y34]|uniref:Uncharacterized protein n=2 Tax=Pyricularia oryzae TaxID=318829 RepID=A0AA97PHX7_PYRO3|nr:hypothetical protein OOU_Y34scaffold00720g5 [Pyricularia oryzae Y34]